MLCQNEPLKIIPLCTKVPKLCFVNSGYEETFLWCGIAGKIINSAILQAEMEQGWGNFFHVRKRSLMFITVSIPDAAQIFF